MHALGMLFLFVTAWVHTEDRRLTKKSNPRDKLKTFTKTLKIQQSFRIFVKFVLRMNIHLVCQKLYLLKLQCL